MKHCVTAFENDEFIDANYKKSLLIIKEVNRIDLVKKWLKKF